MDACSFGGCPARLRRIARLARRGDDAAHGAVDQQILAADDDADRDNYAMSGWRGCGTRRGHSRSMP
jgi:hypothetical protein